MLRGFFPNTPSSTLTLRAQTLPTMFVLVISKKKRCEGVFSYWTFKKSKQNKEGTNKFIYLQAIRKI